MKKWLWVISAIAGLSLLAPGSGYAQFHVVPNQVGIYQFSDGTGSNCTYDIGVPVTLYLVLTKPTDVQNGDAPYTTINAFECMLEFTPAGNMFLLDEILPPDAVNSGDNTDINTGFLEYIVEIDNDFPVTEESVVLITFTFMHVAPGYIETNLIPTSDPSIPGEMAFQSVSGEPRVMYPNSGSHSYPVFFWDNCPTSAENHTFGRVKTLYR